MKEKSRVLWQHKNYAVCLMNDGTVIVQDTNAQKGMAFPANNDDLIECFAAIDPYGDCQEKSFIVRKLLA